MHEGSSISNRPNVVLTMFCFELVIDDKISFKERGTHYTVLLFYFKDLIL